MTPLLVRMDDELHDWLLAKAASEDRSAASYVRQLLRAARDAK